MTWDKWHIQPASGGQLMASFLPEALSVASFLIVFLTATVAKTSVSKHRLPALHLGNFYISFLPLFWSFVAWAALNIWACLERAQYLSNFFFFLFPNACNQVLIWRWLKDWQDFQHKIFKLVAQLNRSMGFLHTFWHGHFHSGSWNVWSSVSEDNRCSIEGVSVPTAFIFLSFVTLLLFA